MVTEANILSLTKGVTTPKDDPSFAKKGISWHLKDRFGEVMATRILDTNGDPTEHSLVHGLVDGEWKSTRTVSDRYQPMAMGEVVDLVKSRLNYNVLREDVTLNRNNTRIRVKMVLEDGKITVGKTPFDRGSRWTEHANDSELAQQIRSDTFVPMIQVDGAYDGTHSISAMVGLFRVVCSNGLVVPAFDGSEFHTRRIHTVHEVERLVNDLSTFEIDFAKLGGALKSLTKRKLSEGEIESFLAKIPKNYREEMVEQTAMGKNTAYAALTYLTYLQTHQMSLARSNVVQPVIDEMLNLAA